MAARVILAVLMTVPLLRAPGDDFTDRVIRFETSWDRFLRRYFGCPEGRTLVEPAQECKPAVGKLDVGAFKRSCERAAELYGFDAQKACGGK